MGRGIAVLLLAMSTIAMAPAAPGGAADPGPVPSHRTSAPATGEDAAAVLSAPLASLDETPRSAGPPADIPRRAPYASGEAPGPHDRSAVPLDPLIDLGADPTASRTPGVTMSFDGTGGPEACDGCTPPDPNGDVGPNHYVQMVNATKVQIWDKAGTQLLAPTDMSSLWDSGPCNADAGDPIVLYDPLADRWLLAQFTGRDNFMCFAVSTTPDPTFTYWLYEFEVTTGTDFPDYFKLGVWPDAYYMSANEAVSGYTAYAFEREQMLAGQAASWQKFTGMTNFLLPADLDGAAPPPPDAPNPFYTFKDNLFHGGADRLEIYEFAVDWDTPANSTFVLASSVPITPFTYTACGHFDLECIPQGGTIQRVDQIGEWPMWRFPYRNFGGHEAVVGTFSVGGGTGDAGSAVRWFELRKSGAGPWTLHQEGTHDLGDGLDRWMGSIAMDGSGGIALGYSASSSSAFPSIRYATRLAADPLGTLGDEVILRAGGGAQTGSDRWGDYAAMVVDPVNDCTYWFTSMYYAATSARTWSTRIGTFTEPSCLVAVPPTADDATFTVPEDAPVGTVVGAVTASGGNGGPLSFTMGWGGSAALFAIDAATGVITTAAPLDYETAAAHTLTVVVSDVAPPTTATIVILVTDVFEIPSEPSFTDVPATDPFFADVEWLAWQGITRGCNPPDNDAFCPGGIVTRGQIAAFLRRALEGIVPVGPPVSFIDDDTSIFEADIEWLGATGITRGCNPPDNDRFCPTDLVNRGQIAAFLRRALEGIVPVGPPVSFIDDDTSIFEADIEWLGATGITRGCNPPDNDRFCPTAPVTRKQMAAFLRRALG